MRKPSRISRPRRDIASEITALILSKLEAGVLPWARPWDRTGGGGRPLRHCGTAYTGTGQLVLHLVKPLWGIPLPASGIHQVAEFVNALPSMARIRDGACVQWLLMNTGATSANAPLLVESAHAWG